MLVEFISCKVELAFYGDCVAVEAVAIGGNWITLRGKLGRMRGSLPEGPCLVAATPNKVTVAAIEGGEDSAEMTIQFVTPVEIDGGRVEDGVWV
jgi:hypothetical protein